MVDILETIELKYIPEDLVEGFLYVSKEFNSAIHLCPCGCKKEVILPLTKDGWSYTEKDGLYSFTPSILNNRYECNSHYYITNNIIDWR